MMVRDAIAFATEAHEGQVRKYGGGPYINHPKEVLALLVFNVPHVTDVMMAAAVLHDVVEDTDVSMHTIYARFGWHVQQLVEELTTPRYYGNRKERKRLEAIRLSRVSPDAQNIKYADILSNIKDVVDKDPKFAPIYLQEKRLLINVMAHGYQPFRHKVWLKIVEEQNRARR